VDHLLEVLGVYSLTGTLLPGVELAEAGDLYLLAVLESRDNHVLDRLEVALRLALGPTVSSATLSMNSVLFKNLPLLPPLVGPLVRISLFLLVLLTQAKKPRMWLRSVEEAVKTTSGTVGINPEAGLSRLRPLDFALCRGSRYHQE
jgi:hypothetical protein